MSRFLPSRIASRLAAHRRGRGFTLIELMVALGISMLLTVIIAELFLQTRRGYATQDDQARLQENIRYTVQAISRTVRQAGWRSYAGVASTSYFPNASTPAITGVNGGGASGVQSTADQITVRFQGSGSLTATDNTMFDCLGSSAYVFGATVTNTFAIRSGSDGNGLFCSTDADPTSSSATWTELVPGVENMQILYGIDNDNDRTANYFVRASDITTANMDLIVSARFALLLRTPTETSPVTNSTAYTLNGVSIAAAGDRRIRRAINFTVNLRNRTP